MLNVRPGRSMACEVDGCAAPAAREYGVTSLMRPDREPGVWLCWPHAAERGFCSQCGRKAVDPGVANWERCAGCRAADAADGYDEADEEALWGWDEEALWDCDGVDPEVADNDPGPGDDGLEVP